MRKYHIFVVFFCLIAQYTAVPAAEWGTLIEQEVTQLDTESVFIEAPQQVKDTTAVSLRVHPSCGDCAYTYYWRASGGKFYSDQTNTKQILWYPPDVESESGQYISVTAQTGRGQSYNAYVKILVKNGFSINYSDAGLITIWGSDISGDTVVKLDNMLVENATYSDNKITINLSQAQNVPTGTLFSWLSPNNHCVQLRGKSVHWLRPL